MTETMAGNQVAAEGLAANIAGMLRLCLEWLSPSNGQVGLQEQAAPSQNQPHVRKQHQNQTGMQISVASVAAANLQSQPMPSHSLQTPQQTKGHLNPPVSLPRTSNSQIQMQQSLQTTGFPHMPLHPPMQPLVQMLVSSTLVPPASFTADVPCNKPPSIHGPLFPQGQPPHANQMPPQSTYQTQMESNCKLEMHVVVIVIARRLNLGGLDLGSEFGSRVRLTPEMEKALLQQVRSLTPEQIKSLAQSTGTKSFSSSKFCANENAETSASDGRLCYVFTDQQTKIDLFIQYGC
ncbi:CRS1 / YhbY domain-containing protein [Hibiscus syriacus]|uniref:CRS1 / YhbY domain-containing protein n=1 Tax=Hibiscus syriacus TaxID=106335 RepID=A0A6A2YIM1_HIBSY|nr:CRS1 / YhbY domain-containing protein [Hibiscus syriacus]